MGCDNPPLQPRRTLRKGETVKVYLEAEVDVLTNNMTMQELVSHVAFVLHDEVQYKYEVTLLDPDFNEEDQMFWVRSVDPMQ